MSAHTRRLPRATGCLYTHRCSPAHRLALGLAPLAPLPDSDQTHLFTSPSASKTHLWPAFPEHLLYARHSAPEYFSALDLFKPQDNGAEVGTAIIPILQVRKQRGEVTSPRHTAARRQSQVWNPGRLAQEPRFQSQPCPLTCQVALGQLFYFCEPQSPHL